MTSGAGVAPALEERAHGCDRRVVGDDPAEALVVADRSLPLAGRFEAIASAAQRERRRTSLNRIVQDRDAALRLPGS